MAKIDTFGMEFEGVPPEISEAAVFPFIVHLGRLEAEFAFGLNGNKRLKDENIPEALKWVTLNLKLVKSPIEAPMAVELCFITLHPTYLRACRQHEIWPDFRVLPQARIAGYVVDFLVTSTHEGTKKRFAVECDGHDFHERTKEQAAHDRKRDRALLTEGIPTLRFTGSEIWRDPIGCGDQVAGYIAASVAEFAKKGAKK